MHWGMMGETSSCSPKEELCGQPVFQNAQFLPNSCPCASGAMKLDVFGFFRYLCQGPTGRRQQNAAWHISRWINFYGISHRGYSYRLSTVVDTVYSRKNVFFGLFVFVFWEAIVRLGSKHLLGTLLLEGFCIERAVRHATSDFWGTCCYQSDVRSLLLRVPSSGPCFFRSASMVCGEEQAAW